MRRTRVLCVYLPFLRPAMATLSLGCLVGGRLAGQRTRKAEAKVGAVSRAPMPVQLCRCAGDGGFAPRAQSRLSSPLAPHPPPPATQDNERSKRDSQQQLSTRRPTALQRAATARRGL